MTLDNRKKFVDKKNKRISIKRQSELLGVSNSSYFYKSQKSKKKEIEDTVILQALDEIYTKRPYYGTRRMKYELQKVYAVDIGRKRIRRLMQQLGIRAIYAEPKTTISNKQHKKYPYLLRGVEIKENNQVWSTDITYIRMNKGWVYLTAVIDWNSRYILSWELSITLDTEFCITALKSSLFKGKPDIFNTDQGCQYTSKEFTEILESHNIKISMDGKGRYLDNIFVERLWRTIKQEEVYLKSYDSVHDAYKNLREYIEFYNNKRPHQSLGYKTPAEIYFQNKNTHIH